MARSFRLFVWSAVGIPVAAGILYLGLLMSGAGHGTYVVWYLGLAASFVCWLLL